MKISPMRQEHIAEVIELMSLGEPYIRPRTASDYWLYAKLFSSTCPLAFVNDQLAGAVFAFRSQDDPTDVYIQDVMVHPDHRRHGIASALLTGVGDQARGWGCQRLYLTSEPEKGLLHQLVTVLVRRPDWPVES
ncbi:hypothetical protein GCM10010124_29190 [Pilimelia terevasa]|uniref:N-acetyltransferase domain-containing protein n=1 Tax=Pilimelia terevasa TaxID=53372 RepID=A0A8J3BPZ7_9ACTN|nr:GNAT family N-acetyltransferase [Pilimelia terevasa]GGK34683.1 hypothetical protein GCM10010124_29190 [Pilimelia terevasa]